MAAIDTNVLLRYLRNDDPVQSAAAQRLIDVETGAADPLLVGPEVLLEVYWFMARRQGKSRADIAAIFWQLLDHGNLRFVHRQAVEAAVDAYAHGPAGFADCLIAAMAQAYGADFVYTFDRDAAKHQGFRLLY